RYRSLEDAMSTKTAAPVAGGRIKTELPGPNARRIVADDNKWISPSYTRSYPMVARRGPHKVYYGNSGAEAIECAIKLSRYHTQRQNIIAFFGAFHGRTMGSLALTASKPQQKRRFAPLMP